MTSVSVHQPNFMPWLKLLTKALASDVFVAYDSVQFTRREFHARQLFRTAAGTPEWLSVPVVSTGSRQVLRDALIAESFDWRSAHLRFLEQHYGKTPYFAEVFSLIDDVYARRNTRLVDHNLDLFEAFCGYLSADVRIVRASDVPHAGTREERLRDLVRNVGGDAHLTSTSGTHQIDWSFFDCAGIPVFEQVFDHPAYPQQGEPFVPNLAAADMLFACGRETSEILRRCNRFELLDRGLSDAAAVTGRWA